MPVTWMPDPFRAKCRRLLPMNVVSDQSDGADQDQGGDSFPF
jgi:hypothetical protein